MGRRLIEVMQVLVDQIHQGGYQHRVLEDSIYEESQKRIAAEKDRDHWKQARQEAHEAGELMRAEIETLRQQLANAQHPPATAQQRDEIAYLRARLDEERSVSARVRQQLATVRAENETLREQLADAQLAVSDAFAEVNSVQKQLAEQQEKVESAERDAEWCRTQYRQMVTQLDAANAAVTLQRAGIERLRAFVGQVRQANRDESWLGIGRALNDLDADTQPAPVAEPAPCPECERLQAEILRATRDNAKVVYGLEGKIKSLQRFADKIRMAHHCDNWPSITMAVDELDGEFTAPIESAPGTEPAPVAERCPECDGSGMVDSGGFGPDGKGINVPCGGDCRGNPCPSQPAPVAEPIDAEGGA